MSTRWIFSFFRFASLLMLLVTVALLAAIITMHFAIHGAEVQVPALKGMTVAQALSETAGLDLQLDVDNRYYSSDVAAGHILTQSPEPGMVVRREWRVRVSESLGPQKVDVPNTVGEDTRVAELALRRQGLSVGAIAQFPDNAVPAGTVLAQDPPAHAQGIAQPSINLLVAAPDTTPPDGYVMPNLAGLPLLTAQANLARVGLRAAAPRSVQVSIPPVGQGSAPPVPPVQPGVVLAQQPPPGARVDQSMLVTLTVAR